jgi:hypothetical protein
MPPGSGAHAAGRAVDEEPGAGCCRLGDPLQSPLASLRVTTVERADSDGEHDVVWLFIGLQDEVFDRNLTDAHASRGDLLGRGGSGLGDGRGGPVDGQDVAGNEPRGDRSCRRAGPAADLKDARVRRERERVRDRRKAGRQTGRHEPESTDRLTLLGRRPSGRTGWRRR